MKILILGGTKEAAALADDLVSQGHDVLTSLAGRTKEPNPLAGAMRVGGFGGSKGLATFLQNNRFDKLIDATHPFAKQISENAKTAAQAIGIKFEIIQRTPWQKRDSDLWYEVSSLEEARDALKPETRVLLALGKQHIDLFKSRSDVFFLVRMVDLPAESLALPDHELLIGKPSPDWTQELAMLKTNKISHIVCRNSGGTVAYAKIEAARHLGLPVIMVER